MAKSYSAKLKDPRWQKKRLEVLDREDFTCENCQSGEDTLHVHHAYYERGRDPWDYPESSLHVLCKDCHAEWHRLKSMLDQELASCSFGFIDLLVGWVRGIEAYGETMMGEDNHRVRVDSKEMAHGVAKAFDISADRIMANLDNGEISGVDLFAIRAGCRMRDGAEA